MPDFGNLIQKAVYFGIGLATVAGEQANSKLAELRTQAQKLADELVARGEMNAEEARRFVEDMVNRAQQAPAATEVAPEPPRTEPRKIDILADDEEPTAVQDASVDALRQQVKDLQDELRRLQQ